MDSKKKGLIGWAIVVVAIVGAAFLGVRFPIPEAPPETGLGALDEYVTLGDETRAGFRPIQMRALNVAQDLGVGGDLTLDGTLAVDSLYPVVNPSDDQVIEFGATGAISVTAITPVAVTTVTAAGCNVNSPSAAAQLCYTERSGNVITFTLYSAAATPAAIVTPHAAGASYWVAGSK